MINNFISYCQNNYWLKNGYYFLKNLSTWYLLYFSVSLNLSMIYYLIQWILSLFLNGISQGIGFNIFLGYSFIVIYILIVLLFTIFNWILMQKFIPKKILSYTIFGFILLNMLSQLSMGFSQEYNIILDPHTLWKQLFFIVFSLLEWLIKLPLIKKFQDNTWHLIVIKPLDIPQMLLLILIIPLIFFIYLMFLKIFSFTIILLVSFTVNGYLFYRFNNFLKKKNNI